MISKFLIQLKISLGVLSILGLSATGAPPERHPLEQLGAIRLLAGSSKAFLANTRLTDQYFEVLNHYFNNKIKKDAFQTIIKELNQLLQKVPDFEHRLSRDVDFQAPIVIATQIKSYAKKFAASGTPWETFVKQWQEDLSTRAKVYRDMAGESTRHSAVLDDLSKALNTHLDLQGQRGAFEKSFVQQQGLQNRPKKEQRRKAKAAWHAYVQSQVAQIQSRMDAALSFLVLSFLELEETQDSLRASADTVLDVLESLQKTPEQMLARVPWAQQTLLSKTKRYVLETPWTPSGAGGFIPRFETIKEDTTLFEHVTRRAGRGRRAKVDPMGPATYLFRPSHPFEGIWKGFLIDECTKTHPRRYLVSAMSHAQTFYVEKSFGTESIETWAHPQGFVLLIPAAHEKTGQTIVSVDFGAPDLGKHATFNKDGERIKTALAFEWLARYHTQQPNHQVVLGQSTSGDNAGAHRRLHKEWEYKLGNDVGSSVEFKPTDGLFMNKVLAHTRTTTYSDHYMFDAGLKTAQDLVELRHPLTIHEISGILGAQNPEETLVLLQKLPSQGWKPQWKGAPILHDRLIALLDHPNIELQNAALKNLIGLPITNGTFQDRIDQQIILSLKPDRASLVPLLEFFGISVRFKKQYGQSSTVQRALADLLSHQNVGIRVVTIRILMDIDSLGTEIKSRIRDTLVSVYKDSFSESTPTKTVLSALDLLLHLQHRLPIATKHVFPGIVTVLSSSNHSHVVDVLKHIKNSSSLSEFFRHATPVHEALARLLRCNDDAVKEAAFDTLFTLCVKSVSVRNAILSLINTKDPDWCFLVLKMIKAQSWPIETFLPQYFDLLQGLTQLPFPAKNSSSGDCIEAPPQAAWLLIEQNATLGPYQKRFLGYFKKHVYSYLASGQYTPSRAKALATFIQKNPKLSGIPEWLGSGRNTHTWVAAIAQELGGVPTTITRGRYREAYDFAGGFPIDPKGFFKEFFRLRKASLAARDTTQRLRALITVKRKLYKKFNLLHPLGVRAVPRSIKKHLVTDSLLFGKLARTFWVLRTLLLFDPHVYGSYVSEFLSHKWILSELLDHTHENFRSKQVLKGIYETYVELSRHLWQRDTQTKYLIDAFAHLEKTLMSAQEFNLPLFEMLSKLLAHKDTYHFHFKMEDVELFSWIKNQSFDDPKTRKVVSTILARTLTRVASNPLPDDWYQRTCEVKDRAAIVRTIADALITLTSRADPSTLRSINTSLHNGLRMAVPPTEIIEILQTLQKEFQLRTLGKLSTILFCH